MALITCPDCGKFVSDAAPACVHCGRPLAVAPIARPYPKPPIAANPYAAPPPPPDPMDRRVQERAARASSSKRVAVVVYVLEFLSFFYFVPGILAIVVAYLKRGEARGTWVESHFDWLISTFWISLWGVLTAIVVGLGVAALTRSPLSGLLPMAVLGIALTLWYLYRLVRGALALNDEKPIA